MIEFIEDKLAGIIFGFYTVYCSILWRFDLERPYSDIGDFWDEINVGYYVNNAKEGQ